MWVCVTVQKVIVPVLFGCAHCCHQCIRLAVEGVFKTWLRAKTETAAHEQPGVISCQMHRACVCAISTPTQNLSLRPGDESEMLRNFRKKCQQFCDYSSPFPTCCTCSKEKANPSEKLRLLSLCSPFPAIH